MTGHLSRRELEAEQLLVSTALSVKDIAHRMGLVTGTVKIYCARVYDKRGVYGRVELTHRENERLKGEIKRLQDEVNTLAEIIMRKSK